MSVVVGQVFVEHACELTRPENQHAIEALPPQGAGHPLTDGFGPWRLWWALDDLDATCREHREAVGDLPAAIAHQEPMA
jgi:hypothetical protein